MQVPLCRHVLPNGQQCQAIALKAGPFCYFHQRLHRTHRVYANTMAARPDLERKGAIFDLGPLEDSVSIQIAISKVVNAIATNMIDLKHGRTILYGLHLAATNARRLNPIPNPKAVVRELTPIGDPEDRLPEVAPEGATTDLEDPIAPTRRPARKPLHRKRHIRSARPYPLDRRRPRRRTGEAPALTLAPLAPSLTLCAANPHPIIHV